MKTIWNRVLNEPAMLYALVEVAIAAALAFGTSLTAEQVAALLGVAAVLTGLGTRQAVVPTRKLDHDDPRVDREIGRGG